MTDWRTRTLQARKEKLRLRRERDDALRELARVRRERDFLQAERRFLLSQVADLQGDITRLRHSMMDRLSARDDPR